MAHDRVIPAVRLEFAKRLRQLRIEKGFVHAREFARALDIEENRYTRYERAEAEPSFTLIHRICVTLQVSPNDLSASPNRFRKMFLALRSECAVSGTVWWRTFELSPPNGGATRRHQADF